MLSGHLFIFVAVGYGFFLFFYGTINGIFVHISFGPVFNVSGLLVHDVDISSNDLLNYLILLIQSITHLWNSFSKWFGL